MQPGFLKAVILSLSIVDEFIKIEMLEMVVNSLHSKLLPSLLVCQSVEHGRNRKISQVQTEAIRVHGMH